MLGLKRGTVRLASYCPEWTKLFEEEKAHLLSLIGDLVVDIQHIGSTSIPGMPAKPIIDMGVGLGGVEDGKLCVERLIEAGYDFRGESEPGIFLFAKGPEENRTHYVHFAPWNGERWKGDLLFRDYLCQHPEEARKYADLKEALAKQHQGSREQYTPGKADFIKEILERAKQESSASQPESWPSWSKIEGKCWICAPS